MTRPPRARAGRDPARRAQRRRCRPAPPLAPEEYRATAPAAAASRRGPRGRAACCARARAAAAARGRRRHARRGQRPRRPASPSATGFPMITAYGRNDAVPNAHPLYLGPLGRAGAPEAAAACRHADVLLAIGSRLGHFTTHFDDRYIRPETAIIQIDVDAPRHRPLLPGRGRHAGRRPPDLRRRWLERARPRRRRGRRGRAGGRRRRRSRRSARRGSTREAALDARAAQAPARLRRAAPRAAARHDRHARRRRGAGLWLRPPGASRGPRTFLTPLDLGGLGFAFPVALGAKLGRPEAPVLAIHGDGGFLMNVQELETAVRHRHQRGDARHEQQLLGLGEGLPAGVLRRALHRLRHRQPALRRATRGCSAPRATTSSSPTRSAT